MHILIEKWTGATTQTLGYAQTSGVNWTDEQKQIHIQPLKKGVGGRVGGGIKIDNNWSEKWGSQQLTVYFYSHNIHV